MRSIVLIGLIVGGWAWFSWNWQARDTRPPAWDQSTHLQLSLDYRDFLVDGTPIRSPWASYYPPLYHWALMPVTSLQSTASEQAVVPVHAVFFGVLALGVALLSGAMGLGAPFAVVAMGVLMASPFVMQTANSALIDVPLMAWVCLTMALLWRTESFARRSITLLWGVCVGVGLLLKHTSVLFMVLPGLMLVREAWNAPDRRRRFVSLLGGLAVAAVLGLSWYGWHLAEFLPKAFGNALETGASEGDPPVWSAAAWGHYLHGIWIQLGPWFTFLIGTGVLLFAWRHKNAQAARFLGSWALSGYLFLTLIRNKDWRYTLPLLPALVVMGLWGWLGSRRGPRVFWVVAAYVVCAAGWSFWHFPKPQVENWQHAAVAEVIEMYRAPGDAYVQMAVLSNHPYFFGRNLRLSLRGRGIRSYGSSTAHAQADLTEWVIFKSDQMGPSAASLVAKRRALENDPAFQRLFQERARLPLPDGTDAILRQRDPNHRFAVGPVTASSIARKLEAWLQTKVGEDAHVDVEGAPEDLARGRVKRLRLSGSLWTVQGLPIHKPQIEAEEVWLNLYRLWTQGEPGLLSVDRIHPRLRLDAGDLAAFLERRVKGLELVRVQMDDGELRVQGVWRRIPVGLRGRVLYDSTGDQVVVKIRSMSISILPIPGGFFGRYASQAYDLKPQPAFPSTILLDELSVDQDALIIR